MNALKNNKKEHKPTTKQNKSQNESTRIVKKNTYHPNHINLLDTPVKVKKLVNEQQSGKEVDHKARTQSKKHQNKTQKSISKMGKGEMSTERKPKNKFVHGRDAFLNVTGTKQKSNKWFSNEQINRLTPAKPEEIYFIGEVSENEIEKQRKNGIKENEKIKSLREYIKEDSEKTAKMNKIRDDHIISELSFVEESLKKKEQQELHQKEISDQIIKIEMLKKNHEIAVKEHFEEISNLQIQLNKERTIKEYFSHKMDEYENTLSLLQREAYSRKRELELEKEENNNIRREKELALEKLRRSQLDIHSLEDTISELTLTKTQLQQQLRKSLADKDIIKMTANKALEIVRSEIKCISLSENY